MDQEVKTNDSTGLLPPNSSAAPPRSYGGGRTGGGGGGTTLGVDDAFDDANHVNTFTSVVGSIPFKKPNVREGHEQEDLNHHINGDTSIADGFWTTVGLLCCPLTCLCGRSVLVEEGQIGLSMLSGKPRIYSPGRWWLANPLNSWQSTVSWGDDSIIADPVSIIRVPEGSYGLAMNNSIPEILLPGVHCRKTAAFKWSENVSTNSDLIEHGPIKIFIVKSGEVRVCYDRGHVEIFGEGRYAVNSSAFRVAHTIATVQQCMRFSKHPVLLDGGISLLVEGLLSFQVVDVQKLIQVLGSRDLHTAIQDISKAEIARVFAGIHLEQISSQTVGPKHKQLLGTAHKHEPDVASLSLSPAAAASSSLLGDKSSTSEGEGEERSKLCSRIIQYISPMCASWGVRVVNFQLESTKIADANYAKEYEQASLGMAKAKANLRSVDAENEIQVRRAQAKARSAQIAAQAQTDAAVIAATGESEARKIEAEARNEAAQMMEDEFAKTFAYAGQQVEFAAALNANVLTVISESGAAKTLVPMFNTINSASSAVTGSASAKILPAVRK